jgi:hypothetical protein
MWNANQFLPLRLCPDFIKTILAIRRCSNSEYINLFFGGHWRFNVMWVNIEIGRRCFIFIWLSIYNSVCSNMTSKEMFTGNKEFCNHAWKEVNLVWNIFSETFVITFKLPSIFVFCHKVLMSLSMCEAIVNRNGWVIQRYCSVLG